MTAFSLRRVTRTALLGVMLGGSALTLVAPGSASAEAEHYVIDTQGQHAFVQFKISHLGYSWLYGNFNDFSGEFTFDSDKPEASSVSVTIDTGSVDSNHAERDKHLRSADFLATDKFPEASFKSTKIELTGENTAKVTGDFTLKGVTKPVTLDMTMIGAGQDPWGGERRGFAGSTTLTLKDFGIDYNLGPASETVEIILSLEGVKK